MATYIFKLDHPAPEVISLTRAKEHLKVDSTVEDGYITDLIAAAIEDAENYIGANINEAKYQLKSNAFNNGYEFKQSPIQEITQVAYRDKAGANQTLQDTDYELLPVDKLISKINYTIANLPEVLENSNQAVTIDITVGYADGKVPKGVQSAVLLILADLYENRQDKIRKLPTRAQSLLRKYRIYF